MLASRQHGAAFRMGVALLFVLAATGCGRRDAAFSASDPVRAAWQAFRLGEFDTAARLFQDAVDRLPPHDPAVHQALYGLATTCNLRTPLGTQDKPRARAAYARIIEANPKADLAAWSLLALARMEHLVPVGRDPDYDSVRAAYRAVIDRFPGHPAADEAFLYLQSTFAATLEPADARRAAEALERFTTTRTDSGFLSAAYRLLMTCYETLERPADRLQAALMALEHQEVDPTNPKQDNAWTYWEIAVIAEFEAGDFATARRFYRRLIEEYPQDIRRFSAGRALERMDALEARLRAEGGPA
jgi:tetratricopeptide (TPR) repeat protein